MAIMKESIIKGGEHISEFQRNYNFSVSILIQYSTNLEMKDGIVSNDFESSRTNQLETLVNTL